MVLCLKGPYRRAVKNAFDYVALFQMHPVVANFLFHWILACELRRFERGSSKRIYISNIFLNVGLSRPLHIYFRLFNTVDSKQVNKCSIYILPMTGFEPRTSGIGRDFSTNLATTTATLLTFT